MYSYFFTNKPAANWVFNKILHQKLLSLTLLIFVTLCLEQLNIFLSDDVANILVREPFVGFQLFHKLTKLAVKSGQELEDEFMADCVSPSLHISLPLFPSLVFGEGKGLLPQSSLFVIKGVLVSHTISTKYW